MGRNASGTVGRGSYHRATHIEAVKRVEAQDQMPEEKRAFYAELYRQMKEKNIKLPPNVKPPEDAQ